MDKKIADTYVDILRAELIPALGCTEPIAIAFAAAKARETLGHMPETIQVDCSGNIIKNVKGVAVPHSGGLMGVEAAAALGAAGGDASNGLEVLQGIQAEDIKTATRLVARGSCKCGLIGGAENLHIVCTARAGNDYALVEIKTRHTHITKIVKNGRTVFTQDDCAQPSYAAPDKSLLNVRDIIAFAEEVHLDRLRDVLERQIALNSAIADEGIANAYGAEIGRTLLKYYDKDDVHIRARARAAAGSDARMSGCALPVIINSGSGNQGLTVSLPVIEFAKELGSSREELLRALCVANLIALLQKRYLGNLSAFCGAVCAAAGAASGITYLYGGRYADISRTITNTLANVGGIVCDGAKPSCAAKIASSVEAALMGCLMSVKEGVAFRPGEGIVKENIEETIESVGRMGRDGMRSTDTEILHIMIGK